MSGNKKGLGRGLDALFGGSEPQQPEETTTASSTLPLSSLKPNPGQPRRHFDEEALRELAASIKSQGIIQPLLVRPLPEDDTYQIVAGERRWRAAQMAGLKQVPVYIRQLTDKEVMAAALIENLQREDLNPIEEAEALQALREALDLTQEELASRLGKSRPAVANALRLLQLSTAARGDLQAGRISAGHARCLLGIDGTDAAEALRLRIQSHNMTVREAEEAAAYWRGNSALPWQESQQEEKQAPQPVNQRISRKKSPAFKVLQKSLSTTLGCTAKISGDENAGRIALNYSSKEELDALLEKFGLALTGE
ncbi:MAG: ParB/RepB/Spo0J family partition protein [Desulfovibrio sp.]|uniref:ParB/RepB/Spo0J family partition protein n=1 Tax=Desulfovibrio sp. TaxID=885 RepID=UPI0039E3B705